MGGLTNFGVWNGGGGRVVVLLGPFCVCGFCFRRFERELFGFFWWFGGMFGTKEGFKI